VALLREGLWPSKGESNLDHHRLGCYRRAVSAGLRSAGGVARVALLVILIGPAARAEEGPRRVAQRLADAAIAEQKKGDQMESGWERAYDRGIALADEAIATDPGVADAYYALFLNVGRKSERSGMGAQALSVARLKELLRKTLERDSRHAHAWEAQGEMLMRLPWLLGGSDEEGERALRRAAELAPKWAKPQLRLAEFDFEHGRKARAHAEAEIARDLAEAAGDDDYRAEAEALLKKMDESGR
jgi:hypothetical protein